MALVDEAVALVLQGEEAAPVRRGKKQMARLKEGVGTILGGVLREWAKGRPVFQVQKHEAFPPSGLVHHKSFATLRAKLVQAGLLTVHGAARYAIQWDVGKSSHGFAGRLWPTVALVEAAARHGITPANVRDEFRGATVAMLPRPGPLVVFNGLKIPQGARRPFRRSDSDADVGAIRTDVAEHNAFAATFTVTGCAVAPRWRRVSPKNWPWAVGGPRRDRVITSRCRSVSVSGP